MCNDCGVIPEKTRGLTDRCFNLVEILMLIEYLVSFSVNYENIYEKVNQLTTLFYFSSWGN